jgi:hypothetical protein
MRISGKKYYSIFAEKYSNNILFISTTAPSTFNIKMISTLAQADRPTCAKSRSLFILLNTACRTVN